MSDMEMWISYLGGWNVKAYHRRRRHFRRSIAKALNTILRNFMNFKSFTTILHVFTLIIHTPKSTLYDSSNITAQQNHKRRLPLRLRTLDMPQISPQLCIISDFNRYFSIALVAFIRHQAFELKHLRTRMFTRS